jgi:predicted extracellular nuclease
VTGSTDLSGSNGKVGLVRGTTRYDSTNPGSLLDLVAYGTASPAEGAAASGLSNTTALQRRGAGCAETDNNAMDFARVAPAPRSSGSPLWPCDDNASAVGIAEVQGGGSQSPLLDRKVTVTGVVVGDFQASGQFGGFYVQSSTNDDDATTSEAVRVFDNRTPVAVGEAVQVTGWVEEYSDAGYAGTETQIGGAVVAVTGAGELPSPVGLELPFAAPDAGVDGRERYEGMRVTLPAGLVATDLYTLGRFGEVGLTTGELLRIPATTEQGAANDRDFILLDDARSGQNLDELPYTVDGSRLPRAGDTLDDSITGVLAFGFGEYRVEPVSPQAASFTSRNPRTSAPDAVDGEVKVASFNVLNYFVDFPTAANNRFPRGADNTSELARQQDKLVSAITALDADVVGLIEIANDDGDALDTLVAALNDAQPGSEDHYTAVEAPALSSANPIGGTYGTDAIRTAIIYRASVVTLAGPPPSRESLLNPADPEFPAEPLFDRPPAIQAFTQVGDEREFTVIVNHLKSKGSTNEQCGEPDEFGGNCDDLRERQAAGLADLVKALNADDALLLGDFNSYEEEAPIGVLERAGYVNRAEELPAADRYSYSFDGEFGTLDYIFASSGLAEAVTGVDIWHINSAESPAYDYNNFNQPQLYSSGPFGSSDHDPVLIGLDVDVAPVADAGGPYTVRVGKDVVLDASGSSDLNGDELTYAWDLDGDGAFDDATGPTATSTKGRPPGYYTVAVQVSDGEFTTVDETEVTYTAANGQVPPGRR